MLEMSSVKVSVIVPVYNTEKYVGKCVDSILQQSLEDIELICIDDGSDDRSGSILGDYANKDSRVRVFRQENQGQATARNVGIEEARGEYICFVDSDDWLSPDALKNLYQQAAEEQLDILYFAGNTEFEAEEMAKEHKEYFDRAYRRDQEEGQVVTGCEMLRQQREKTQFWRSACMCLIRKEFLTEAGIRFRPGVLHEDNLFAFVLCLKARRTASVKTAYYHRLLRDNSTVTSRGSHRNLYGYLAAIMDETAQMKNAEAEEETRSVLYAVIDDTVKIAYETWKGLDEEEKNILGTELGSAAWEMNERDLYHALIEPRFENIDRERNLQKECVRQKYELKAVRKELQQSREEAEALRGSFSFRLGNALLAPVRWIKGIRK